jgi:hypothetical protein
MSPSAAALSNPGSGPHARAAAEGAADLLAGTAAPRAAGTVPCPAVQPAASSAVAQNTVAAAAARSEDKGQAGACPDQTRAIPCKVRAITGII